jgi:WhiB family redox-sensing transcriptional regulator
MDQAACVGTKLDLWFSTDYPIIREAKKICAGCPVAAQCLVAALEINVTDDHGVLGGTTPLERRKLRRKAGQDSRHKKFCHNGHEFTEENTRVTPRGLRVCRACRRADQQEKRAQGIYA